MAAGIFLCISSTFLYPTSYRGNIICNRYFSGPPFYHTTLVLRILRLLRILTSEPLLLPKSLTCLYFPYRLKNAPNIPNIRLSCIREKYTQKGQKLQKTRNTKVMQSWNSGTGNKCNTYQKQWVQFSSERNQDPFHPPFKSCFKILTLLSDSQCWITVSLTQFAVSYHLLVKLMVSK